MKKMSIILLKILLPILLILLTMSFITENIAIKTISHDILTNKIKGYMLDEIINKVDNDKLFEIADKIENSKYIEKITHKYLDIISYNLTNTNHQNIDITEEINLILENDLEKDLPENIKHNIISYMSEKSEQLQNSIEVSIEEPVIEILNTYRIFTSFNVRIILAILCILGIIGLIILEKINCLKSLQKIIIITVILSTIIFVLIKFSSTYIEQRLSGGWIDNIDLNLMLIFIIVEIFIALVIYLVRRKLNINK